MNTIYKAIPNQTNINITYLDESLQFIGNDVESITVDEVNYGRALILDEFDSLKEIHIKRPGAVISFNRFPKQTIRIKGAFEEIRVKDGDEFYNLHRFGSNPTLPIDTIWGAVVTSDARVDFEEMDALMIKTNGVEKLELNQEISHLTIIGDLDLTDVKVTGKRIMRSLTVHRGPSLESLRVERRVLSCTLRKCPVINTVIGFGDRLAFNPKPPQDNILSIGGFWHQVPGWYNQQTALLKIPHFRAHLTAEEIVDCSDMGGIKIQAYAYDAPGGQIHFSEAFGIDIEEASNGIEVQKIIELIERKKEPAFKALESWCRHTLDWFDQYKAMRIIASLISRGYDKKPIISLRNLLSEKNTEMPKMMNVSVNDGRLGGHWHKFPSEDSNEWETPMNSVMPFGRIDLEIWLNTDLGVEFIGMTKQFTAPSNHYPRRRLLVSDPVIRNLLTATLSAANSVGRNTPAEKKLTELAESLYTKSPINCDPYCCEFTVYHLSVSRVATKETIGALVDGILSMQTPAYVRAALLVGIVEITNSARAQIALMNLTSEKMLSLKESTLIDTISILGQGAFTSGKVERLDWPFIESWENKYRN